MTATCKECKENDRILVKEYRGVTLPNAMCVCCANDFVRNKIKNKELDDPFTGDRA